jgi:hypothetical protein
MENAVFSMEYRLFSMENAVFSMEYRLFSMENTVFSMEYRLFSMEKVLRGNRAAIRQGARDRRGAKRPRRAGAGAIAEPRIARFLRLCRKNAL